MGILGVLYKMVCSPKLRPVLYIVFWQQNEVKLMRLGVRFSRVSNEEV